MGWARTARQECDPEGPDRRLDADVVHHENADDIAVEERGGHRDAEVTEIIDASRIAECAPGIALREAQEHRREAADQDTADDHAKPDTEVEQGGTA